MNKVTRAFEIGYAAVKSQTATPFCHNTAANELLAGNAVGNPENIAVMNAYYAGIDKATEEELAELMKD